MSTNADIMKKLCANGYQIEKLGRVIEELRGTILLLQLDNDRLKKEVEASKIWEQKLSADLNLAVHRATLADDRSHFLEQYSRNYNLRMYSLEEPDNETAAQCEDSVLHIRKRPGCSSSPWWEESRYHTRNYRPLCLQENKGRSDRQQEKV